jgi:hypothetical protein
LRRLWSHAAGVASSQNTPQAAPGSHQGSFQGTPKNYSRHPGGYPGQGTSQGTFDRNAPWREPPAWGGLEATLARAPLYRALRQVVSRSMYHHYFCGHVASDPGSAARISIIYPLGKCLCRGPKNAQLRVFKAHTHTLTEGSEFTAKAATIQGGSSRISVRLTGGVVRRVLPYA